MKKPNWKAKFEAEYSRANFNAHAFHELMRHVTHASKVASGLHHAMERDSMGICLPPYMALAILANKQAAYDAYMAGIRQVVK